MATNIPAKKSMGPKRKGKKQFSMVTFELEGFEGDFTIPNLKHMPLGALDAEGEAEAMRSVLRFLRASAPDVAPVLDPDDPEAMDGSEFSELFMPAWQKASGVDSGKSSS